MSRSQTQDLTTRVALIRARWHAEIVDEAVAAFTAALAERAQGTVAVELFDVPGAFEIPLLARRLAQSGCYAAVAAAGFVVDGGIYRHDFVASAVIDGLMRAQMDADVPVLSAVLTPHHFHDREAQRDFFRAHFRIKGRELAEACLAVLGRQAAA